jgi:hypothetical protein
MFDELGHSPLLPAGAKAPCGATVRVGAQCYSRPRIAVCDLAAVCRPPEALLLSSLTLEGLLDAVRIARSGKHRPSRRSGRKLSSCFVPTQASPPTGAANQEKICHNNNLAASYLLQLGDKRRRRCLPQEPQIGTWHLSFARTRAQKLASAELIPSFPAVRLSEPIVEILPAYRHNEN